MRRWILVTLLLLAPLIAAQAEEGATVTWLNARQHLDVGQTYTARFLVEDDGEPVPQAVVRVDNPPGSRIDFQELVTNNQGLTFASLIQDEPGSYEYSLRVTGRIEGADITDEEGPVLTFAVNFTEAVVAARGDPLFAPAGTEADLVMSATWAHTQGPIPNPDPDASDSLRFVIDEVGEDSIGLKKASQFSDARIPFDQNEAGMRLFEVGVTNVPDDVAAVATVKTFIVWLDDAQLVPEVVRGCVAGAGAGIEVTVAVETALNDHWVPVVHETRTGSDGCYRVETQFLDGDTVTATIDGDSRPATASGGEVQIDLDPADPYMPGSGEGAAASAWWLVAIGVAVALLLGGVVVWRMRK